MIARRSWPKVANDLSWAPYVGWTILFDPADGDSFDTTERDAGTTSLAPVACVLAETLSSASLATVAVLPVSTHHVTVCDGVDPAMFARSPRRRHHRSLKTSRIERFPRPLADSISTLLEATSGTLDLKPDGAERRGGAIVISLAPTPSSAADFAKICSARTGVLETLGELLGLPLSRPWRPHVTLGYLADQDARKSAKPIIAEIDDQASRAPDVLRMHGAGLYGFTSMVEFHRIAELGTNRS